MAWQLKWPLVRRDALSRVDYTDRVLQQAYEQATSRPKGKLGIIAAASGMWANALGGAECDAPELTPHLSDIGHQLVTRGWWAARLDFDGSALVFRSASHAEAVTRDRWRLTIDDPQRQTLWTGTNERVVWVPWSSTAGNPWRYESPLKQAADSVAALVSATGHADQSLRSTLRWIFLKDGKFTERQIEEFLAAFDRRINTKSSALVTMEADELKPVTTDIADELPELYAAIERSIGLACQIPPVFAGSGQGDPRAAASRFSATVQSVANRIAREASRVLERPVKITI